MACSYDRLDLVQEPHEISFPWDTYAVGVAAQNGYVHVLEYLHEANCPANAIAINFALHGG